MRGSLLFYQLFIIIFFAYASEDTLYIDVIQSDIPLYKTFYDDGLYEEAIKILDSLIRVDTLQKTVLLFDLASCYIAKGDTVTGRKICEQIVEKDSSFYPDTILTSPKILGVFRDVKDRYKSSLEEDIISVTDTLKYYETNKSKPFFSEGISGNQKGINLDEKPVIASPTSYNLSRIFKYTGAIIPFGGGHFVAGQKTKGILILTAEVGAMCGMIWAYYTRQNFFESGSNGHGWYEGNKVYYNKYTNYSRISFGFLVGVYIFEVADSFYQLRKKNK